MDDILMRSLLSTLAQRMVLRQMLICELETPSCDICNSKYRSKDLSKCIFCKKAFCVDCSGRANLKFCKVCNNSIVENVNWTVLKAFSIKELRFISDNFEIPIHDVVDKESFIEAILKNFKKCFKPVQCKMVDVENSRQLMNQLKIDEQEIKEKIRNEEVDKTKIFSNYSNVEFEKNTTQFSFKDGQSLGVRLSELPTMKIRDIKDLLNRFGVEHSDIIERVQLESLARGLCTAFEKKYGEATCSPCSDDKPDPGLKKQNASITEDIPERRECTICMDAETNCVFLDCGHCVCCYDCGQKLFGDKCPFCRSDIRVARKIFFG